MKKQYLFSLWILILLGACNNTSAQENKTPVEVKDANYAINMHFAKPPCSANVDTLFLLFRITEKSTKNKKKVFWSNLKETDFEIKESDGLPPNVVKIEKINQERGANADLISQDAEFLFLVDRGKTIAPQDMEAMKDAIKRAVDSLPDRCAYISFFDKTLSEKKLITKENFNEFEKEFKVTKETRYLYENIFNSFEKFAKENVEATDISKYLLIFTDGRINPSDPVEVKKAYQREEYFENIDNNHPNQVQIHAFKYGKTDGFIDQVLGDICMQRLKPELDGGFYPADNVSGIIVSLRGFMTNLSADYELTLLNDNKKIYNGTELNLQVIVGKNDNKAVGEIKYTFCSKEKPCGPGIQSEDTYIAIILGIIVLFIAFFIMQVVIPFIISRMVNFEKEYVKPYIPISTDEGEMYETCSYCQEPLERGELVVVKCRHKTHWDCWKENGCKCVEYGQNCKEGIQFHFDKNHAFDLKKSPYYLKWAMSGMIGGFFIWIIYHLTSKLKLFPIFIDLLLQTFYPKVDNVLQISSMAETTFHSKISGLLLVGILLGFVLTFLFTYINDFRQKKGSVVFSIFMRALIGAMVGFASFLIGSVISIRLEQYGNVWWADAIPWLLFGGSVALCLVYKTTIKWQDALIGGLISSIVSFFILYTTSLFPAFGVMFSFMLCSAGLGISIVARHHLAQKYFLKYKGERREGEIAIHKWMNDSGGNNEVTIGISNHCIIQMNWDNSGRVPDKQVKLYIDPKRRVPIMKVLENGMIYEGRDARKDDQLPLKNGVKFTIGNTEFQYVEK